MATTVTSATMYDSIWKNFFDLVSTNVTTVTLADSSTSTIQRTSSYFPDNVYKNKANFPVIVIQEPNLPEDINTFRNALVSGTIDIEVDAIKKEEVSKFLSAIRYQINQNESTLNTNGIYEVQVEDDDADTIEREGLKIHYGIITFSFQFDYTKWS